MKLYYFLKSDADNQELYEKIIFKRLLDDLKKSTLRNLCLQDDIL